MTPTQLFNTYYPALCLYGSSIIRSDAEDLVMNVFKKLLEGKITIDNNIAKRLYFCVKNECIDYINSKKRNAQPDELITSENAENLRIKTEVVRQIYCVIARLPKGQRMVIIKHWLEGIDYKELSAETGVCINTLRNQCKKGMDKLRLRITKDFVY